MSKHEGRYGQEIHTSPDATDASSFDDLAKGLASGNLSRRKALQMLGAALVGGALASVPGVAWAAKPAPCPSGKKCGMNCCPDISFVCSRGKCACPTGTTQCGGTCVDPTTFLTDPNNCGQCGVVCQGGTTCQNGGCACPAGQTLCGGVCRDLLTDELNCGLCGSACAQGASCVGGQCVSAVGGTCTSNAQCASGICQNGTCLSGVGGTCTSDNHCVTGTTCQNGTCLVSVGGTCTDNTQCASGTCEGGVCACPTGTTLCPGNNSCVQDCLSGETLDPETCTCEPDTTCPPGTTPGTGVCAGLCVQASCPEGQIFVDEQNGEVRCQCCALLSDGDVICVFAT